jgi:hypothetical protein
MAVPDKLKKKPKAAGATAASGGLAALAVAALSAMEFLPADLVAELSEKILSGGLTITSIITGVLVFLIAHNRKQVNQLRQQLDELIDDADTPPVDPENDS